MPWGLLCVILALFHPFHHIALAEQAVLQDPPPSTASIRKLHGRFLHITDIHPDPDYKVGASPSTSCHRKATKKDKDKEKAGYWGVPYSECDSPPSLVKLVFEHLHKHWSNKIDFIVWTGDSARHDNDNKLPRTPSEIYELNRDIVHRMQKAFPGVPIVPSLGNNDIWPHNIMTPGPNQVTYEFSSIWRPFLPFSSYQVFQRGAYYSVEVIPDHVAVISLNTLYWYDSNKAVDGCEYGKPEDPGNLQFDWLEVQLSMYRERGMQVWMSGHIPPSPGNYFPECYYQYGELALRYQDTILGHLFGHMNVDHFFWIEPDDLVIPSYRSASSSSTSNRHLRDWELRGPAKYRVQSDNTTMHRSRSRFMPDGKRANIPVPAREMGPLPLGQEGIFNDAVVNNGVEERLLDGITDLHEELLHDFRSLPRKSKTDLDDFVVVNVGPSVLPAYVPSFRVFQYNVTGFQAGKPIAKWRQNLEPKAEEVEEDGVEDEDEEDEDEEDDDDDYDLIHDDEKPVPGPSKDQLQEKKKPKDGKEKTQGKKRRHGHRRHPKPDCDKDDNKNRRECVPLPPRHADPNSPSRTNSLWSPLGYAQYYLPDIGTANKTNPPKFKLEYLTFPLDALYPNSTADEDKPAVPFDYPVPPNLLPKSLRHYKESRKKSRFAPFGMKDLTIPEWIKLARRLAAKDKLFGKFKDYMYMGEEEEEADKVVGVGLDEEEDDADEWD